jgi:predicted RNA binding protein YcfA (HicA-like mRNA interferase family)
MPRLPPISGAEMAVVLHRAGFRAVGRSDSHVKFRDGAGHMTVVPMHPELALGTQRKVMRQAGLGRDDFTRLRQAKMRTRESPSAGRHL